MGLTVHFNVTAPANWTPGETKSKLEQAQQFAQTLPVVSVSDLAEFRGHDAEFQRSEDADDPFGWAKMQAQRSLLSPWFPGTHGSQSPSRMLAFSVLPAEGCEQMNIGMCAYPQHVWKPEKRVDYLPAWSLVFDKRYNSYPESRKVMRAFIRRWHLRRLPPSERTCTQRFGSIEEHGYFHPSCMATAHVRRGRYLSHRKGYGEPLGLVTLRDRMKGELLFRFMGTAQKAEQVFVSSEFQADLDRLVHGAEHITPAASGVWGSFCKTQYANAPDCGGWANFAKAHVSVCAILENLQSLGFEVEVYDEGHFWENRDLEALAKTIGEWDVFIAGMAGMMKDAAEKHGMVGESAMSGRPDFERLEAKVQENPTLAALVQRLKAVK